MEVPTTMSVKFNTSDAPLTRTTALPESADIWVFRTVEGPREAPLCTNCRQKWRHHVDGKCPFEASRYDHGEPPYLFEVEFVSEEFPSIGMGNLAAVRKIQIEKEDEEDRKYARDDD